MTDKQAQESIAAIDATREAARLFRVLADGWDGSEVAQDIEVSRYIAVGVMPVLILF